MGKIEATRTLDVVCSFAPNLWNVIEEQKNNGVGKEMITELTDFANKADINNDGAIDSDEKDIYFSDENNHVSFETKNFLNALFRESICEKGLDRNGDGLLNIILPDPAYAVSVQKP